MMRKGFCVGVVVVLAAAQVGRTQEKIELTTPADVRPGHAEVSVCEFAINLKPGIARARVVIELCKVDAAGDALPDGEAGLVYIYDETTTPTGQTLVRQLNTANLTVTSLQKRIMQRVQADDPALAGTVTGTPQ